ncbi:MAG: tryptophan 7-halogenase [Pseudomonadota bacterium]
MRRVDVAIAGGGPGGAAAAIALARTGLRVRLVDAGRPRDDEHAYKVGEGLPPSARALLRALGVLERTLADGHRPSPGTLAYWGADTPHAEDHVRTLFGHGLQLDRHRFDAMLRDAAGAAGAEVHEGASVRLDARATAESPHRLRLRRTGADDEVFEARWLIDATGRNATFARAFGAHRLVHDRLFAFHQRLRRGAGRDGADRSGDDLDGRTLVEAVEQGWWYSVRLPGDERLIAFLCDPDATARRALLEDGGLWRALADAPRLHALCEAHGWRPQGRAHGAEAGDSELDHAAGHRWLAVGDAALAFDPLSSKGMSNALYTGLRAAETILRGDRSDPAALADYAQHLREIHAVHRAQSRAFYAMERRWPVSPFWRRRAVPAPLRHRHSPFASTPPQGDTA